MQHRGEIECTADHGDAQGQAMRTFDANRLPRHLRGQGTVRSISDIAFMDAGQYGLAAACNNGQVRRGTIPGL